VSKEDILKNPDLSILAESNESGVFIVLADEGKSIFVTGHPEYDRITHDKKYTRDKDKGLEIQLPRIIIQRIWMGINRIATLYF
jgi:homoserine O-succinyltransferase